MHRVKKVLNHLSTNNDTTNTKPTHGECPYFKKFYKPVKVVVTGGAGNIAYSILFGIGSGKLLGPNTPIELRLLDIPIMKSKQEGVVMELKDCAYPLLKSIESFVDYENAFKDIDIALLIGAKPRSKGMERSDLLKANANIFEGQGKALDKYANKNVKVVVVGNPANTNCLITMKNAPSIPKENFTAMTRLDQNRAKSLLCDKLNNPKIGVNDIKNVIIFGNHSSTMVPETSFGIINNLPNKDSSLPINTVINDNNWLNNNFTKRVQQRGSEIIKMRGLSSAASAGNACLDHIRNWINGTLTGEYVSMAVYSNGEYGMPKDIYYSFPCTCSNGNYTIVDNLPISSKTKELMLKSAQELVDEKNVALGK